MVFFEEVQKKYRYLESGNKKEAFYRLIEKRDVKEGLGELIIGRFKECMEGNKYIGINCYYDNTEGKYRMKDEGILLKERNMEYLILLLILCENIEDI